MNDKQRKAKTSIRNVLISVFVILFFLAIIMVFYTMLYRETREGIITRGQLNARISAQQIDNYLSKGVDTIKLVSYTLDDMIHAGKSEKEIHDYLVSESIAVKSTTLEGASAIYGYINDTYLDGAEWDRGEDFEPTDRPWYVDAKAYVGRVAVVDPYIDLMTNTLMITFSKSLCDAKSVVALDFSIDPIQEVARRINEENASEIEIILDQDYQVIAHSDQTQIGKSYLLEEGTFGRAMVDQLRFLEGDFFQMQYGDSDYIIYATRVSNDWYCLSVANATNEFRQLNYLLIFTVLIGVLVFTILAAVLVHSNKKQIQFTQLSVQVVEALAAAIDAKDHYTNGHSDRVAEYARRISKRYGYSEKRQDEIYMMGLLHDVGKIGIPDSVINKPARLTDEEYEIIKEHPATGATILGKARELGRMAIGAHWHHERYDGKGYPDGLAGEEIPEEARIIAVADSYDAMTSRRSYRGVLPQEVVRKEIEKGKGSQFDPVFADIMLQMMDEDKEYKMCEHASGL